jgi:DNA-binding response OmpR family regulator
MPTVSLERASSVDQPNIMIVDDNPANLKLLDDMLRQQAYEVRSFPLGRLAIAAAEQESPDLILLDVNMPEMNGYEVCERLKSSEHLAGIPVIFISALNATEDKIKGFRSGGVDYVSKPFQFEEVHARVETQLKLRRAQRAEHELLEKTLTGAVDTLWELVQLSSPVLASRSCAIQDIVRWMTKRLKIMNSWQYELAARLCLLGCLSLPDEVFERAYSGENLPPEEEQMFRAHPESAARLLSNIPRLEMVAEMIRNQQKPEEEPSVTENWRQGAYLLHLALQLDQRIYRGVTLSSALKQVRLLGRFDPSMLEALENYSITQANFEVRRLPIRDLRPAMVLEEDILSNDRKLLILKKGTVLTRSWIQRLGNFDKVRSVQELLCVRVPGLTGTGRSDSD